MDDEHNIVDKLKAQATEANTRAIMRELEKSAKLLQGNVSAATLYRKLNQNKLLAFLNLRSLLQTVSFQSGLMENGKTLWTHLP